MDVLALFAVCIFFTFTFFFLSHFIVLSSMLSCIAHMSLFNIFLILSYFWTLLHTEALLPLTFWIFFFNRWKNIYTFGKYSHPPHRIPVPRASRDTWIIASCYQYFTRVAPPSWRRSSLLVQEKNPPPRRENHKQQIRFRSGGKTGYYQIGAGWWFIVCKYPLDVCEACGCCTVSADWLPEMLWTGRTCLTSACLLDGAKKDRQ